MPLSNRLEDLECRKEPLSCPQIMSRLSCHQECWHARPLMWEFRRILPLEVGLRVDLSSSVVPLESCLREEQFVCNLVCDRGHRRFCTTRVIVVVRSFFVLRRVMESRCISSIVRRRRTVSNMGIHESGQWIPLCDFVFRSRGGIVFALTEPRGQYDIRKCTA